MTDIRALSEHVIRAGWCIEHTDSVTFAQFALEALQVLGWYGDNMRYPSNEGSIFTCYKDFVRCDEGQKARELLAKWSGDANV